MADRPKFLLGYGERLTERVEPVVGGSPKKAAYSFDEAKRRLAPMLRSVAANLAELPDAACPNGEAVAVVTIHPEYLAKSYYPVDLLRATGLEPIGSKPARVKPDRWAKKGSPSASPSTELFVSGKRRDFLALATELGTWAESLRGADELARIEAFRAPTPEERIISQGRLDAHPLLEVVLHTPHAERSDYIVDAFLKFAGANDGEPDVDRRIYIGGLCFMPLRIERKSLREVARFPFMRAVRPMPKLRPFSPVTRSWGRAKPFEVSLPDGGPVDPALRVAVFDGGLAPRGPFAKWADSHDAPGVGKPRPEYLEHGHQVTSALLFGCLSSDGETATPFGRVDHFRVLDESSGGDDDLYDVLHRIRNVLQGRSYEFINLSIGPELPVDDDEVHAWTATLDEHLSSGKTLATVAVGNGGERDESLGYNRVQVPSDSVNALAVGATDSPTEPWGRADYSSVGPGRSPGAVKPDVVAFGGSNRHPFWVLDDVDPKRSAMTAGTSFATPSVLRAAMGVRAHFGELLTPLAIRALVVHCAVPGERRAETGWGRVPDGLDELVTCPEGTARIVYQGELSAAQYIRAQIPVPAEALDGMVTITATLCYSTAIDPEDPGNYTRSGLDVVFRPHRGRFPKTKPGKSPSVHPSTAAFFQLRDYSHEDELRRDAHKWETVLHRTKRMRGEGLMSPVFDIHYNARASGRPDKRPNKLRYALVLTVKSPKTSDLYERIAAKYRTHLEPLIPVIQIPVRTRGQ